MHDKLQENLQESVTGTIYRLLVTESKVPVVQINKGDKETQVTKYEVTGKKGDQYKHATWDWLLKAVPREDWQKYGMEVKVSVWDAAGKPAHDQYGQVFTPDKPSIKAAKDYAKKLIADGIATMTEVVGLFHAYDSYRRGRSHGIVTHFGTWERGDKQ